jgi:uncharacterized protein YutE (UPF0331/DUF86 family)
MGASPGSVHCSPPYLSKASPPLLKPDLFATVSYRLASSNSFNCTRERLLQIAVECVIDVCNLLVAGLRLGLPAEEDDLFEKLEQAGLISPQLKETIREMKGFRNILVHEYGHVDDAIVYQAVTTEFDDFANFKREILEALKRF